MFFLRNLAAKAIAIIDQNPLLILREAILARAEFGVCVFTMTLSPSVKIELIDIILEWTEEHYWKRACEEAGIDEN